MASAERSEVVNVSLKKLYQAICAYENYPQFATGISNTRVLERSPGKAKVYFDVEMMKKVDYTLELRDEIDESAQTARVQWSLVESKFFKISNGLWDLKALGPDKTQVLYKLEIDFSFPVPGFVLKKLVASALPKTIEDFVERAKNV